MIILKKKKDCEKKREVEFYSYVVVTTPQDRSSRYRILHYGERLFPSMRTASFLDFFTSGRRSSHEGLGHDMIRQPHSQGSLLSVSTERER